MKIAVGTTFMPVCDKHNSALRGEPKLVHPNIHAVAVWEFDFSDMWCSTDPDATQGCNDTWELRA